MGRKYEPFKGQKFDKLHKHCRQLDVLFNDSFFPASTSSLGSASDFPDNVEWKRPGSLVTTPRLLGPDGASGSVLPGRHSCLHVAAACAVLAGSKELLAQAVPSGQAYPLADEETGGNYAGVFHFRFWRFGRWLDVVVDDMLPCVDGKLLFSRSARPQDMWLSLLEKAYAKLHGSYSALAGAGVRDVLVDVSGGASEAQELRSHVADPDALAALARALLRERAAHSLMCAALPSETDSERGSSASSAGARSGTGLHPGRYYTVSDVKKVHLGEASLRTLFRGRERVTMVRLRDPMADADLGADARAKGEPSEFAFSAARLTQLLSRSPGWAQVAPVEKQRLGLALDDEAELWMPLEDFACNFGELVVVRLYSVAAAFSVVGRPWRAEQAVGAWRTGIAGSAKNRAGGADQNVLRNPQFLIDVEADDMEVAVQLLQWDADAAEHNMGLQRRLIGFSIIKVELNRCYRLHALHAWTPSAVTVTPARRREVSHRGSLARGRYVVVPFTAHAGEPGDFLLRTFATTRLHLRAVEQDLPAPSWCSCLSGHPQCFTVVHVRSAEGLPKVNRFGSCDPYCEIRCEGSTCRTRVAHGTREPVWDASFVFLRRHPEQPLEIRVWSHNALLRDAALGRAQLAAPVTAQPAQLRLELSGADDSDIGAVVVDVLTDDHLTAL